MALLTLSQKIDRLTWWDDINKLKDILKELFSSNGAGTLQEVTDAGNTTTNEMFVDDELGSDIQIVPGQVLAHTADGEARFGTTSVNTRILSTNQFSEITAASGLGLINNLGNKKSWIRNEDVTASNVILQIPNVPTGEYTIALESAISGTFPSPTSITVTNGIITAIT